MSLAWKYNAADNTCRAVGPLPGLAEGNVVFTAALVANHARAYKASQPSFPARDTKAYVDASADALARGELEVKVTGALAAAIRTERLARSGPVRAFPSPGTLLAPAQHAALEILFARSRAIVEAIADASFRSARQQGLAPAGRGRVQGEDVPRRARSVYHDFSVAKVAIGKPAVPAPDPAEPAPITLRGDCAWDPEHGLNVVLVGEEVRSFGE